MSHHTATVGSTKRRNLRLMQGVGLTALAIAIASPALAQTAAPATVEEVVVTGTSIRGSAPVGSNLVSVTRDDILTIGAKTTQDIIRNIPALGAFGTVQTPSNDFGQVGIKPSIHNIGAGATLLLVNGHRLVGAGILQTNADASVIPPSAIARVEVIADGASSIYGSDAVAGVINLILRKNYDGAEVSARYGFADNYTTSNLNAVIGRTWEGGSFMVAGEYTENSDIFAYQRDFVKQDQRSFGGTDLRSNAAIPPNITVNGRTYAYPNFSTTPNLYDTAQVASLIPDASRFNVLATARHQVTDNIEVYAEGFYSVRKSVNTRDPGGQTPTITTANPFFVNVPGEVATSQVARFNMLPLVGTLKTPSELKGAGFTFGANIKLPNDWQAVVEGNLGREDDTNDEQVIDAGKVAAAAAGTTTATALDPYTGRTSASVLAGFVGLNAARNVQNLREVSLKFDGPLFALPGGEVKAAVGAQYHFESLSQSYDTLGVATTLKSDLDRNVKAVYAELLVPIFGGDFTAPGFERLDLSASIRHDKYSDAGETTNPKVGINWTVGSGLNVHGSYGTSFRAPPLADKNPASIDTRVQRIIAGTQFAPPGAPPSTYFYLAGSDPSLTPEEAKTFSWGFDYSPPTIEGLRFGVTNWRVKYTNIIAIAFPPGLYTDPSLRQYYVDNPTNAQIAAFIGNLRVDGLAASDQATKVALLSGATRMIDLRRKNLGILDASGLDFDVNYRHDVGPGVASIGWTATKMNFWKTKATQTAATVDNFLNGTQIRWRSRTSANYRIDGASFTLSYNHVGSYTNLGVAAQPTVDAYKTVDFAASYDLPSADGLLSGVQLTFNIDNVGNQDPPIRFTGNGYSGNSNPLGRTFTMGILKKW